MLGGAGTDAEYGGGGGYVVDRVDAGGTTLEGAVSVMPWRCLRDCILALLFLTMTTAQITIHTAILIITTKPLIVIPAMAPGDRTTWYKKTHNI